MVLSKLIARSVDLIPWGLRDRIRKIPGVAPLQRALVSRALDGKSFTHEVSAGPARGLRFPIVMPAGKLYWTGTYEIETAEAIATETPQNGVCYDIGGHHGYMAGIMAVNGSRRVYCFEPNPDNLEKIARMRDLNPDRNIEAVSVAVGGQDGQARFTLMAESSMGKLADSSFQADLAGGETFEVTVRALDSLLASGEIEPPDFMKIDIEGAEFDALKGAQETVARHRPTILIEVHSAELAVACRDWLLERAYQVSFVQSDASLSPDAFRVCHLLAQPEAETA